MQDSVQGRGNCAEHMVQLSLLWRCWYQQHIQLDYDNEQCIQLDYDHKSYVQSTMALAISVDTA